jgi:hypothetical protein
VEINKAIPVARDLGVKIAIENVGNNFVKTPEEAVKYLDAINNEQVGWHFDIGNVGAAVPIAEKWIEVLGKRIVRLHIKDFSAATAAAWGEGRRAPETHGGRHQLARRHGGAGQSRLPRLGHFRATWRPVRRCGECARPGRTDGPHIRALSISTNDSMRNGLIHHWSERASRVAQFSVVMRYYALSYERSSKPRHSSMRPPIGLSDARHYLSADRYTHLNRVLGIPVIIITATVGTTIFGTLNQNPDPTWKDCCGPFFPHRNCSRVAPDITGIRANSRKAQGQPEKHIARSGAALRCFGFAIVRHVLSNAKSR